MSPYRLLILLGVIDDLLEFLFFIQTRKLKQVYPSTTTSLFQFFCEDFLYSLFKMEKEDNSCYASSRKNCFRKKNEYFENILSLNVLLMHHQSASDHALDSVEHL